MSAFEPMPLPDDLRDLLALAPPVAWPASTARRAASDVEPYEEADR